MNNQGYSTSSEFFQLRLVIALAGLASVGGCAFGPSRPSFVPVSPAVMPGVAAAAASPNAATTASTGSASRPTTAPTAPTAPALPSTGVRASPRVTMSPLQSYTTPQAGNGQEPIEAARAEPSRPEAGATTAASSGSGGTARQSSAPMAVPASASAPAPAGSVLASTSSAPSVASVASVSAASSNVAGESVPAGSASVAAGRPDPEQTLPYRIGSPPGGAAAQDLPRRESAGLSDMSGASNFQIPLNQCWGQVTIVPTARKKVTQLVTEQARTRYKVSQARLRSDQMPVVVKDAAQTYKLEQPQYVQVTESVKIQDEYTRLKIVPAVYKTIEEDVLVESARTGLRPCAAVGGRVGKAAGMPQSGSQCSYEIPARYRKVQVQTLVKPESVIEEVVPAVYKTISRMVVAEPAKVVPVEIPASTVQMPIASVETPPAATPEQVQAVTMQVDVTEYDRKSPQLTWSRFICESELTPDLVMAMQKGLQREGFMRGTPDGKFGLQTLQAAKDFQGSKGIQSDFITYQTLEWLGVQTATASESRGKPRSAP